MWVRLGPEIQPRLSIVSRWPSIFCPLPTCLIWGENSKCWAEAKRSSVLSVAVVRICDCTLVLISSSSSSIISHLQHPWIKSKLTLFWLGCHFPRLVSPLVKVICRLSFERLRPLLTRSSLPAWQPWEPSDLSGLKAGSPPWVLGFPWGSFGRCSCSPASPA